MICFIISIAFFIPIASALSETSTVDSSNQNIGGSPPPATIFDGPPATIFDGAPDTIFDGPPATIFDTNGGSSSQSSVGISSSSTNASNSQNSPVGMQKTGLPFSLLILAIFLVFGGFIGYKRRSG